MPRNFWASRPERTRSVRANVASSSTAIDAMQCEIAMDRNRTRQREKTVRTHFNYTRDGGAVAAVFFYLPPPDTVMHVPVVMLREMEIAEATARLRIRAPQLTHRCAKASGCEQRRSSGRTR